MESASKSDGLRNVGTCKGAAEAKCNETGAHKPSHCDAALLNGALNLARTRKHGLRRSTRLNPEFQPPVGHDA